MDRLWNLNFETIFNYVYIELIHNSKYIFKGNVMPTNYVFSYHNEEKALINIRGKSEKCCSISHRLHPLLGSMGTEGGA